MSSLTTLARPYAKAAFDLANGQQRLADWDDMLALAADMVSGDELSGLLDHPDLSQAQVAALMGEAAGDGFDESFNRFLAVLADSDRLSLLPQAHAMYSDLRLTAEQRMQVRVVSAMTLDDEQADRLRAALERRFDRAVALDSEVDAGLLGGAVIYAGGEVIDGSLRGRLERMASELGA